MFLRIVIVLFLHLSFVPLAAKAATATVDELISGILSMSGEKCRNRGQDAAALERDGKAMEARGLRNAEATICDCIPTRLRALQIQLSPTERSRRVTQQEFLDAYSPRYLNACAANSLRQSYGEGCPETIGSRKPNGAKYCSCMAAELSKLTDVEAAQLGGESAAYASIAAQAKTRGEATPARPPMLTRFAAFDASCTAQ